MKTTRKNFIRTALNGTAGLLLHGPDYSNRLVAKGKVIGANDRINVAVIGVNATGGFGFTHVDAYKKIENVRLAAICDVDTSVLAHMNNLLDKDGIKVKSYTDLRVLFENRDIDAVSIVLPNHWHALATIWACQAGKHVCVEKPVSHNIWEGRKMVEAARKYKRLVQADLDCRSNLNYEVGFEYMRKNLGEILSVHIINYKRRPSIGKLMGPGVIPSTVDYDIWTGPAPLQALPRERLHYDWHWQWLTGNSELGNNGPHWLDLCRWGLGKETLPGTAMSFGGRYGYIDDGNTPNTHIVFYDYDGIPVIYDSRGLGTKMDSNAMDGFTVHTATGKKILHPNEGGGLNCTLYFVCQKGYLLGNAAFDNDGRLIKTFSSIKSDDAKFNFIKAVRNNKIEDLKTDILQGHVSAAISHMGNISYKIGHRVSVKELIEKIRDKPLLYEAFERFETHLNRNGIDLKKEGVVLGPTLTMDSQQERFIGEHSELANLFLKDSYREPYVIPESV